jgi:hypothetical protein
MNLRKILVFIILLLFVSILWHGIKKEEFAETKFNGNLL